MGAQWVSFGVRLYCFIWRRIACLANITPGPYLPPPPRPGPHHPAPLTLIDTIVIDDHIAAHRDRVVQVVKLVLRAATQGSATLAVLAGTPMYAPTASGLGKQNFFSLHPSSPAGYEESCAAAALDGSGQTLKAHALPHSKACPVHHSEARCRECTEQGTLLDSTLARWLQPCSMVLWHRQAKQIPIHVHT